MPFQIIRNDITKVNADVIANTANPKPVIGSGTDSAVYHAAGESLLLAERRKIGDIMPGDAAVTPAFQGLFTIVPFRILSKSKFYYLLNTINGQARKHKVCKIHFANLKK